MFKKKRKLKLANENWFQRSRKTERTDTKTS